MTIGFKEWQAVCDALGRGEQSLILRKGGIADASGRFRFEHDGFFLFPTLYHEQAAKLRPEIAARFEMPPRDMERSEVSVDWV